MPVDRELFSLPITKDGAPNWPCPKCGGGYLRLVPESLSKFWTADTNEASAHEAFEASWVKQRFVAMLRCDNQKCQEPSVAAGIGRVEEWPNEQMTEMLYEDVFTPLYVFPSPKLIALPTNTPSAVLEELTHAFSSSWGDFPSAGNRIRVAAERLMDNLRIQKVTLNKKQKREPLSLHARIDKTKQKYPSTHESLLAIKWLGNAGSHSTTLSRDAVFDAFDIFEAVLSELYSTHPSAIKKLVGQVNARRGPVRAKKLKPAF